MSLPSQDEISEDTRFLGNCKEKNWYSSYIFFLQARTPGGSTNVVLSYPSMRPLQHKAGSQCYLLATVSEISKFCLGHSLGGLILLEAGGGVLTVVLCIPCFHFATVTSRFLLYRLWHTALGLPTGCPEKLSWSDCMLGILVELSPVGLPPPSCHASEETQGHVLCHYKRG